MNVNGILAAQRPGAGLAGSPGGCSRPGPCGACRQLQIRLAGLSRLLARACRSHGGLRDPGSAWTALCGRLIHVCTAPRGRAGEHAPSFPGPGMIRAVVPGFHRIYVAWLRWFQQGWRRGSVVPGSRDPVAAPMAGE